MVLAGGIKDKVTRAAEVIGLVVVGAVSAQYAHFNIGLVYKFDFGDGRARFELAEGPRGKDHHHHLVCTGCGRIVNYRDFIDEEVALLKKTEEGLSKNYNFAITNHLIQFYGLCEGCRKK